MRFMAYGSATYSLFIFIFETIWICIIYDLYSYASYSLQSRSKTCTPKEDKEKVCTLIGLAARE